MTRPTSVSTSRNQYTLWFVVITAVFVTSLVTANIIAVKLAELGALVFPAAVIIFPISYIFGDVLTEVYGYKRARLVIWIGFLCNLLAVIAIELAILLPPASFWNGQSAFVQTLGFTPRLLIASFIAYLIGEFANSFVLARLKIATAGKWLWLRTISSTIIGEGLDSLVFITLAFGGEIPVTGLQSAIVTQWLLKTSYEILVTPITYYIVNYLKRVEDIDTYDVNVDFNPFHFR